MSGELVLVCGDFHVPQRCADIPEQFRSILVPNKMQQVLCTGNLTTRESLDYLRTLAPRVTAVRGDFDEDDALPETKVVQIGGFRVGLCHGHQVTPAGEVEALATLHRSLDVDVLITGHTHRTSVAEYDGKCYANPGSITGAFTPLARKAPAAALSSAVAAATAVGVAAVGGAAVAPEGSPAAVAASAAAGEAVSRIAPEGPVSPSFMLMNVAGDGSKIDFFIYELTPEGKLKISRSVFNKPAGGAGASAAAAGAGASSAGATGGAAGGVAGGSTHATGRGGSLAL